MDNRSKWKVIRDIGIGQKCHNTSPDVDVKGLNDKFVKINVPTPDSNIYNDLCFVPLENPFSFRCVKQLEALECLSSPKSNANGSDDLDPLFSKAFFLTIFYLNKIHLQYLLGLSVKKVLLQKVDKLI